MRALRAQWRSEVTLSLRNGESLLVTFGIPVLLLVFFSLVEVLPLSTSSPVDVLAPGILSLAVMSTAMVSLGIATGFERGYGVLKRLGTTPLGRPSLVSAKVGAVALVEVVQVVVIVPVAFGLGWAPGGGIRSVAAVAALALGTAAFAGIGLLLAGTLRAELNLAVVNALYLLLLLLGGMVVPLSKLPGALHAIARALPASALTETLSASLRQGPSGAGWSWAVLAVWALAAPLAAAVTFRWE
jgi:ABC-2 type transport system permease protein